MNWHGQSDGRLIVGAMCGTSLDGLDVATVTVTGWGLDARIDLTGHVHAPLGRCRNTLLELSRGVPREAGDIATAARELATDHVTAIEAVLEGRGEPDLIVIHGQTVHHEAGVTWQLFDPAPVQARWSCPIVTDLRRSDLSAGGDGAPITPLADWMLFRGPTPTAVINLGGFCNATVLPAIPGQVEEIEGFDICACNQLLDAIARRDLDARFDRDGAAAARGTPHQPTIDALWNCLAAQAAAGRSLGSGDSPEQMLGACEVTGEDLAASAVIAIARTIHDALSNHPLEEILVAGGGAHNRALLSALTATAPCPVATTGDRRIDIEAREAAAMAILGDLAWQGVAVTLPEITGRGPCCHIAGQWTIPVSVLSGHEPPPTACQPLLLNKEAAGYESGEQ